MKFLRTMCSGLLFLFATEVNAESSAKAYQMLVWADVAYDESGRPTQIDFPHKDKYPKPFIQKLQLKLALRNIAPKTLNDVPVTYETGVLISLSINPHNTGEEVKIDGISELPRPIKQARDKFPEDLLGGNWSMDIKVKCLISEKGLCEKPKLVDSPNVPQSARRYVLLSIKGWRFKPIKLNGNVAAADVIVLFPFSTEDPYPPEFFGKYVL